MLQDMNDEFTALVPLVILLGDVDKNRTVSVAESIRRAYFHPGKITKSDVGGGINVSVCTFYATPPGDSPV